MKKNKKKPECEIIAEEILQTLRDSKGGLKQELIAERLSHYTRHQLSNGFYNISKEGLAFNNHGVWCIPHSVGTRLLTKRWDSQLFSE